jgi:hypothetical protein
MRILRFINFPVFLASFLLGLLVIYIYVPDKRKIYVYPTPETVDILQYRDKTGQCFSFQQKEVSCPNDESLIESIPIQT